MKQLFILVALCSYIINLNAQVVEGDVTYFLFTPDAQNTSVEVYPESAGQYLSPNAKIVFIIHGSGENVTTAWVEDCKDAFFTRDDYIYYVILVDWSGPASADYIDAVANTHTVGALLGDFLTNLTESQGIPLSNFHLVGGSLGAHVAGFAGKTVQNLTASTLSLITALEPAGPLYVGASPEDRLASTDAVSVVALHTDRELFGYCCDIGTIDIYANGGFGPQPGCPTLADPIFCSHHRSLLLYIEALQTPNDLVATSCSDLLSFDLGLCTGNPTIDIGAYLSTAELGEYYLNTNAEPPYGQG